MAGQRRHTPRPDHPEASDAARTPSSRRSSRTRRWTSTRRASNGRAWLPAGSSHDHAQAATAHHGSTRTPVGPATGSQHIQTATTPSTDPSSLSHRCTDADQQPPELYGSSARRPRPPTATHRRHRVHTLLHCRRGPGHRRRLERQTIYRCLRRLAGHEPGSAHHDLQVVDEGRLRVRR